DGFYDRTELDSCASPADPNDFPGGPYNPDANADGLITPADIAVFVNRWFASLSNGDTSADFDRNGVVNNSDLATFVNRWFSALSAPCIGACVAGGNLLPALVPLAGPAPLPPSPLGDHAHRARRRPHRQPAPRPQPVHHLLPRRVDRPHQPRPRQEPHQ